MTLQSTILRVLVVCVASIFVLFLYLQQKSPTIISSTDSGDPFRDPYTVQPIQTTSSIVENAHQIFKQTELYHNDYVGFTNSEKLKYLPLNIAQEMEEIQLRTTNQDSKFPPGNQKKIKSPQTAVIDSDKQTTIMTNFTTNPPMINKTHWLNALHENRTHQRNQSRLIPDQFLLDSSFQLPWHRSKPVSSIMEQDWYLALTVFLQKSTPNLPIVLVAADEYFKSALINWLIFALVLQENPVKNLLVLTYDASICSFIRKRQLTDCLHIPPATLTAPDLYDHRKYGGLYPLLVVRVVVMRVLNRLGYDVANFDSDAILLRNPIPVFEEYPESDVIGTYGGGLPGYLLKKWGVVLCMGAIFLRSTESTESLWESVREYKSGDDQIKLNNGINAMNVKWTTKNLNRSNSSDTLSTLWQARGKDNLNITLLPQRVACRGKGCIPEILGQCYIWHHGKNKHKFKNMSGKAKADGLWKLRKDWLAIDEKSSRTGMSWLREMMMN